MTMDTGKMARNQALGPCFFRAERVIAGENEWTDSRELLSNSRLLMRVIDVGEARLKAVEAEPESRLLAGSLERCRRPRRCRAADSLFSWILPCEPD